MDIQSVLGFLIAIGGIVGGMMLEGGKVGTLFQIEAFLIVIGGTLGAVLVQHRFRVVILGLRQGFWLFFPPRDRRAEMVAQITEWSHQARHSGLLVLGNQIESIKDPFTKRGLQMVVDGLPPSMLQNALEQELDTLSDHRFAAARIWEAAGGYAPTIGILGAVLGLIEVMQNLTDPAKLGGGIAVAFVATIYGVGSANLFFLPLHGKVRYWVGQEMKYYNLIISGLVSIAQGDNALVIDSRLRGYLD